MSNSHDSYWDEAFQFYGPLWRFDWIWLDGAHQLVVCQQRPNIRIVASCNTGLQTTAYILTWGMFCVLLNRIFNILMMHIASIWCYLTREWLQIAIFFFSYGDEEHSRQKAPGHYAILWHATVRQLRYSSTFSWKSWYIVPCASPLWNFTNVLT